MHSLPLCRRAAFLFALCFLAHSQSVAGEKNCPDIVMSERNLPLRTNLTTMALHFETNPNRKSLILHLIKHYRNLGSRGPRNDGIWNCDSNPETRQGLNSARSQAKHLGRDHLFDCMSVIDDAGKSRKTYAKAKTLFRQIEEFSEISTSAGPGVVRNYGLHWLNSFSAELLSFRAADLYRTCSLATSIGYRLNGRWGVGALLTNYSIDKAVKVPGRGYFMEMISLDKLGTVQPLKVSMPLCNGTKFVAYRNGTAILSTWGGVPSWSHFYRRRLEENPAILEALQRGGHEKELVEDSDTLSNLSILLLPAALALVPIGLFQDVSLSLTLLYALATDVVSVLPVAIKGIELIWHGTRTHLATTSYLYGAETTTDTAIAETWVASCGMKAFVQEKGIALLSAAVGTMLIGIVLEFVTRWSASKHRRKREEALDEFGAADRVPTVDNGGLLSFINKKQ